MSFPPFSRRMWGGAGKVARPLLSPQFIFLPPAEAEVVQRPAIGSFLTPQGGSLPSLFTCPIAKTSRQPQWAVSASLSSYLWLPDLSHLLGARALPLTAAV